MACFDDQIPVSVRDSCPTNFETHVGGMQSGVERDIGSSEVVGGDVCFWRELAVQVLERPTA